MREVRQLGFNAVRLQWSNQMFESDPVVPDYAVAANPGMRGLHAMQVFDRVVRALSAQGTMVILDTLPVLVKAFRGSTAHDDLLAAERAQASAIAAIERDDTPTLKGRYRMTVTVPAGTAAGPVNDQIVLRTDHPKVSQVEIPVNIYISRSGAG